MDVRKLLEQARSGNVEIGDAQIRLKNLPCEDLGYVRLGYHRKLRSGSGETVFYQGEPGACLLEIYKKFYGGDGKVLGTRTSESQAELVRTAVPEVVYGPISRIFKAEKPGKERKGCVAVCTGDTTDIPVVKGAAQTAEYSGCSADRIFDVGVTRIHRLLAQRERLGKTNYIVAVTGMEGVLSAVIAGSVECPVVAAPTSVGYGVSFHGLSALLTMSNSCANGASVANIDNGYEVDYLAARINRMAMR